MTTTNPHTIPRKWHDPTIDLLCDIAGILQRAGIYTDGDYDTRVNLNRQLLLRRIHRILEHTQPPIHIIETNNREPLL